jgi:hypothetical protein
LATKRRKDAANGETQRSSVEDRPKYPLVKIATMSVCGGFHPAVAAVQTATRKPAHHCTS